MYCWKSIISQLESILQRTGIPELCEQWRRREVLESVLSDVYDGQVWKNFKWSDRNPFFNVERHYGLILNVYWFQPFKRRSDYSVGVIYFVIINLPRSERFKFESVILGGIIPSLESEPKLHTFLEPCVDELNGLNGRACECQLVFPLFHLEWLQLYCVLQQTYLQHVKLAALWGTLQRKPAQSVI